MIEQPLVCNIKHVMFIRFLLGFRQNYNSSMELRFISTLYPLIFSAIHITSIYCSFFITSIIYIHCAIFDYIMFVLIAFYTKDEYIYKFFNFIYGIDNLPAAKKMFNRLYFLFKCYVLYIFCIRLLLLYLLCINEYTWCFVKYPFAYSVNAVNWIATDMGRFPIILVFSLFYCRTKIIRMTVDIESKAATRDKYYVKKYINMYELLVNSLDIINKPMKMTVTGNLLTVYIRMTYIIYEELAYLREEGFASWSYVFIIVNITDPIVTLMGAAIVADLISDEYNYLRTKFIELRIYCDNERHHSELKQLQLLLENCPLRFYVLPNIPLTFSLFLCSISFVIINVVAVLQIKSLYSDISPDIV